MRPARALWLIAYLTLCPALERPAQAQEVRLKADRMSVDVPSETYQATGSVRLEREGALLLADSVVYRRLTGDAFADGNVFMEKAGDTLRGTRLTINLDSQQGELLNGELFVKKTNFRVTGERLQKTGDEDYRVQQGSFTTCDGDHPSWHFEARELEVTLDEFATGRHAVFYVGKVPLLYTPYLIFPVKRDRQSGLLLPHVGHSTKKGAYYVQPWYWAISPSQDVTFDLDLQSARGAGAGADYRYLRKRGSEGELQVFGIYDSQVERFRGELNQRHLELLTPSFTLASDVHLIADRAYYRDYSEDYGEYNRQLLSSSVSFDKQWERFGASGEFRYVEDLVAPNNKASLQMLPALGFVAAGSRLGPVPLYFSMDSGLVNFQRVEGVTGQRLILHPRLTLYQKPAGIFDLALSGGYQERFYNAFGTDAPGGIRNVGQADAGGSLSLPLERIYQGRYRHLITPSVDYGFVQTRSDDDVHLFDYNDQVLGQSILRWSVTSTLTGKELQPEGPARYRDLSYLRLSQGYQFSGTRRDLLTLVDPGHRLTDLMLESKTWPRSDLAVLFDSRYNTVDNNLSTANLALQATWGDSAANNLAQLGYRYSRDELNYLEGHFAFPVTSQVSAKLLGRYSIDKGSILESRYALEYKRQCWSIIASYTDRPDNKVFNLNFTLAGIGALVPVRAF
jgi:LPS-assembly protein